ncbi:MAG: LytTR family DNA-binding domain-containing protein [Porphyromonadaceae bacterium]|nr:LytTR family DNA-binding domain-containing protein [Porphyromonadaceae bacterium]
MKLKCAIIDDEPLAVSLLKTYVEKTPFLELTGTYTSAVTAMGELIDDSLPDLLFLDIQMPEVNGLEFSRIVGNRCRVIFTTAFEQYAVDSYRVNALDYLLKPFSYADFLQACEKARQWFEKDTQLSHTPDATPESIFVKSEYKLIQIDLSKILYIEGLKDYVKIYTEDEVHPILSLMSLKSLEEQLPQQKFVRVHRSFIVQMDKIKIIERNRIVFGKTYIPISDSYKDQLVEQLNRRSIFGNNKQCLNS